jgi:hypothetical protein
MFRPGAYLRQRPQLPRSPYIVASRRGGNRSILSIASVPGVGVRLTEFSFCGETSLHMVHTLAAKTEFCKPDPFLDVYHC